MAASARNLMTAAAVSATLLTAGQTAAAEGDPRMIVVRVHNYAHVLPDTLRRAETRSAAVYAGAGIRTVWATGDADEHLQETSAFCVTVLLLPRDMAERFIAAEQVADHVLGLAVRRAKRAYIFSHRVTRVAAWNPRDIESVLGSVIAHEVGHLVLPTGAHLKSGIMRANLDVRSIATQRFTAAQGFALRTIVAAEAALR